MIKRLFILMGLASFFIFPIGLVTNDAHAVQIIDNSICSKAENNASSKPAFCKDKDLPKDSDDNTENPLYGPKSILVTLINLLSLIAGIIAIIIIVLAGLKYVTSGSNPQDSSNARERIIYAVVGLAVVGLSQFVIRFIIGKTGLI